VSTYIQSWESPCKETSSDEIVVDEKELPPGRTKCPRRHSELSLQRSTQSPASEQDDYLSNDQFTSLDTWKESTPTKSEATGADVSLRRQFGRRLVETATLYKNRTILRGSEAYTSKQCGACGTINDRLGSLFTI